ncbi:MAG: response regulator [Candidatus Dormibacteraceae bacterium]
MAEGPRILVADDDPPSLELVTYFLESRGYSVATATDGNRAVEMGSSGDYPLIILDVHMPTYDGVEVLQFLRKRHILHPVKIIALTADPSTEVRAALEGIGIDSFVPKPVQLATLLGEVRRLLSSTIPDSPAL